MRSEPARMARKLCTGECGEGRRILGALEEVAEWLYLNPATDDVWEFVEAHHETERGTVVVDLTVRYVLSMPEKKDPTDEVSFVLRPPSPPDGGVSCGLVRAASEDVRLALKLSGEAPPSNLRQLRVELYRQAMGFVHAHDVRAQVDGMGMQVNSGGPRLSHSEKRGQAGCQRLPPGFSLG